MRHVERIKLGRAQRRTFLAICRDIVGRAVLRGPIDAPVLVHHRGMRIDLAVPGLLHAPIGRRIDDLIGERRTGRIGAERRLDCRLCVVHRVEHRLRIAAELGVAIDRAVGVDRRIAPVGRRQVVQIMLGVEPVAHRHDDVALDADRPRRAAARQFARLDAVGPIGERLQMAAIRRHQLGDEVHHVVPGRSDRQPIRPRVLGRLELAEFWRQVPRRVIADLVAIAAAIGLDEVQPLVLGLEIFGNAVAFIAGAGEAALVPGS